MHDRDRMYVLITYDQIPRISFKVSHVIAFRCQLNTYDVDAYYCNEFNESLVSFK